MQSSLRNQVCSGMRRREDPCQPESVSSLTKAILDRLAYYSQECWMVRLLVTRGVGRLEVRVRQRKASRLERKGCTDVYSFGQS